MISALCIVRRRSLTWNILSILGGSLFLALMAQCALPLPFTMVPLTLQTLGVLLIGSFLGSKRGLAAVFAYISEGAMGLPFFAQGGSGLAVCLGPKGGYFLGFIFAVWFVGYMIEKREKAGIKMASFLVAELLILSLGTLWLSLFVGIKYAFAIGFLPFIFCGMIKAVMAYCILRVSTTECP